ncbi:MAG: hypothetical protein KGL52_14110 [Rhodospirillales bacterium]|nr:hypothetical protein [Rhodospirillales bacterium]
MSVPEPPPKTSRPRRARAPIVPPRRELLDQVDRVEARLSEMIGGWGGAIPPEVRAELRRVAAPLFESLMRAGRR